MAQTLSQILLRCALLEHAENCFYQDFLNAGHPSTENMLSILPDVHAENVKLVNIRIVCHISKKNTDTSHVAMKVDLCYLEKYFICDHIIPEGQCGVPADGLTSTQAHRHKS